MGGSLGPALAPHDLTAPRGPKPSRDPLKNARPQPLRGGFFILTQGVRHVLLLLPSAGGGPASPRPQVGKVEFVLTAKTTDREIDELTDRTPAEREALKRERDRLREEGSGNRELSLFDEYVVEKGLEPVMSAYDLDSEQMFRLMNSLPDRRRERLEKLFAQGKRPTKGRRGTFTHMLALHELEEQMKALGLRHEGGGSLDEVRRKHGSAYGYTDADFLDPSEGLHGVEVEVRDQYGNISPHAAKSEAKKSGSGIYRDRMTFEVKRRGSDKE